MEINLEDAEMLLGLAQEMASYGYRYIAYPLNRTADSDAIEFFRTSMGAEDHCLVGQHDTDYFKSMPIGSLINDLKTVIRGAIDISGKQTLELASSAQILRGTENALENNLKGNTMNQKNLEFLENQIKYTGFGESLNAVLKEQMEKGEKEFMIPHEAEFGKSVLQSELSFKRSDQSDLYFFNSYKAMLSKEGAPHALEQIFYIGKDNNFTMKEAFNLLEGRSVNKDLVTKDGEIYNSWISLDFKDAESNGNFKMNHYHQNYGYNLEAALEKHSIKELETPKFREDLMNSLKKGNIQSVTVMVNGEERKRFVEANPQFKTIRVYDASMQRINGRVGRDEKQKDSQEHSVSKSQKTGGESEVGEEPGQKEKKQKRKSQSI
ncbi:hypothetical protein SAMN02927916_3142 [Flavobacterium anhuiense]|uniref:Uncharacterized protein n=1 Tax=Flavobacterium anhuiense TaxID=459526 RepID=A0ABY0LX44_9FLAO|nr:hypothetical protein [Flavobacterium anhuiense]SCY74368.1 hypothetical protein SAMN02927916_3142 [Flavobacterium anhuiense]